MKNILILTFVLSSILLMSCGQTPQEKSYEALQSTVDSARYDHRLPSIEESILLRAGQNMDAIAKTGDKISDQVESDTRLKIAEELNVDSNRASYYKKKGHLFFGFIAEGTLVGGNSNRNWLVHDPDCQKCANRTREELKNLIIVYSKR